MKLHFDGGHVPIFNNLREIRERREELHPRDIEPGVYVFTIPADYEKIKAEREADGVIVTEMPE